MSKKFQIVCFLSGFLAGIFITIRQAKKYILNLQKMSDKHLRLLLLMCRWVELKQLGKSPVTYFEERGYKTLAVYGMNYVGERFLQEMDGSRVKVLYAIDRNADEIYTNVEVVTMEDDLPVVDAVVVTPVSYFTEVKKQLSEKVDCPVLSLEDILRDM